MLKLAGPLLDDDETTDDDDDAFGDDPPAPWEMRFSSISARNTQPNAAPHKATKTTVVVVRRAKFPVENIRLIFQILA